MPQSFTDIPATQSLTASRQPLLDRDAAAASNFSGTAFPTANLLVGMRCHRTDLNKVYALKTLTPSATWIEVEDIAGSVGVTPRATALATARTISVAGDVATASGVAFDGSGNITLNVTLASVATPGSYARVTVNAKGQVTSGGALTNSDLPASPDFTTVRITSTGDAALASTGHGLQIGPSTGINLAIDNNEIMARNNGAANTLLLNADGGNVGIGSAAASVSIPGTLTVGTALNLPAGSVLSADIADNAVVSSKIASGAVTAAKIAADAVGWSELNVQTGSQSYGFGSSGGSATIPVPAGILQVYSTGPANVDIQGTAASPVVFVNSSSSFASGTVTWSYFA